MKSIKPSAGSWFKVNKIAQLLARLTKKRGRTQINKIRNEEEETATDTAEIQKPEQNPTNNCLPTNSTN